MHVNLERRNGADRRSSAAARGQEQRWNEAALADLADVGDEPYDPYDPYWEPVKGQDDD
jgi:hypothetical protein